MLTFTELPVITATAAKPVSIYYCKAGLPTGKTVRVSQKGRETTDCSGVKLHSVSGSMMHGNSAGKAKASGARCVLIAEAGSITILP
jgi:hypothetical protein